MFVSGIRKALIAISLIESAKAQARRGLSPLHVLIKERNSKRSVDQWEMGSRNYVPGR
jgi:hypothetical protein